MKDTVYLAEVIWFGENPVDGRIRLAVCTSLERALKCIKEHPIYGGEDEDLVATEVDPGALGTKQAQAWAVHPNGEEPDDEGCLWIVAEKIDSPGQVVANVLGTDTKETAGG